MKKFTICIITALVFTSFNNCFAKNNYMSVFENNEILTTGTISGTVVDSATFEPIENVLINVEGTIFSAISTEDGTYTISNVDIGIYDITATAELLISKTQFDIEVIEGDTAIVNFFLTPKPPVLENIIPGIEEITLEWDENVNFDNSETGHFTTPQGDPSSPLWSIYINTATWDGNDLEVEDEIAIFDDDLIVGVFTLSQVCTPDNCFDNVLIAFSEFITGQGYTPGNLFSFKAWDESEGLETSFCNYTFFDPYGGNFTGNYFPYDDGVYSIMTLEFFSYLPNYNIYYKDSTLIASGIIGNSYTDSGLTYGQEYCYFITRVCENGMETPPSNILCASPLAITGQQSGTISDIVLNPIKGAVITIEGTSLTATSGPIGTYFIDNIPIGDHSVNVSAQGYETKSQEITIIEGETSNLDFSLLAIQSLSIEPGFQFVSSRVIPIEADMEIVAQEIINDDLYYIRDSRGYMLRKIGPNWANGIGDWVTNEGYLIKTSASGQFTLEGSMLSQSTPIDICSGFQFVSYLPLIEIDAFDAFNSVISDNLVYIRNSEGSMLRKVGPDWVNGIGNCIPGEAYLTKILSEDTLIYPFNCGDPFTDLRDGQTYKTVQIGEQCWMAENLNCGLMINSDLNQINNDIIEKYCYDNDTANCETYGGLYQWDEMMQYTTAEGSRGICPPAWHLPSDNEWTILTDFLGGWGIAGGEMKEKGIIHWNSPNTGATNESGFTAKPGGCFLYYNNIFDKQKNKFYSWSSTSIDNAGSWQRGISYNFSNILRSNFQKVLGLSVRCIKDSIQTDNCVKNSKQGVINLIPIKKSNYVHSPQHFNFKGGNPAQAVYTLYFEGLEIGDEVAVFDGGLMVGAIKINSEETLKNELPVFSSTLTGQGYNSGNSLIIKVWDGKINQEIDFNFEYKNPYGDAFMDKCFPKIDGEYSILKVRKNSSGIDNISNNITIYPNPSTGKISIRNLSGFKNLTDLEITDLTGKTIFQSKIKNFHTCPYEAKQVGMDVSSIEIDLSEIKKGIYILNLSNKDFKKTKKIVIQ
ncbi:MAG: carboxypeptidase regulatory-like domain-containing protein [Bacteroidales bacterium]|nr:carboxypeptidase regulatory-like domain-containing protein [Bacteroidales bacterium]